MNAKIKWVEDQKMLGESGTGHSVVMDALDSGKGVSPMEMLLLGVGGCTSLDVLRMSWISRYKWKLNVSRLTLGFSMRFVFIMLSREGRSVQHKWNMRSNYPRKNTVVLQ